MNIIKNIRAMKKQLSALQKRFDSSQGSKLIINENVQGPLIIDHACTVFGNGFTLWSEQSPAIIIKSSKVRIENLCVCVKSQRDTAIKTEFSDTELLNVEVNGRLEGFGYDSDVRFPAFIQLGKLSAGNINTYILGLNSPSDAKLECGIHGVRLSPQHIHAGYNEIRIEAGHLSSENIIYGDVNIITEGIIHKLRIFGEAHNNSTPVIRRMFFNGSGWDEKPVVQSGECFELSNPNNNFVIEFRYSEGSVKNFDIDPCIFLLNDNGKTRSDDDMFYFNNKGTSDTPVNIQGSKIYIRPGKADVNVKKISLYYAILSDDPSENFQSTANPCIIISDDGKNNSEKFFMPLIFSSSASHANYKTLHALDFCRTSGKWKIYFDGRFCRDIRHVCESFGLRVN